MGEVQLPVIKVVGVSASGKSTLVARLRQAGYNARAVSQEHSNVLTLWQQFDRTSVLIYLDASLEIQRQRRPDVTWDAANLQMEQSCLAHARDHADLKIDTAALTSETVWRITEAFLQQQRIRHADQPLAPDNATGSALPAAPAPPPEERPTRTERRKQKRKRTGAS
ncbi:MAG: hypothetical protein DYG89_22120 [Caldilinea sp. CFX5]|nr:hypothetical protein [Caldilinea sp. CFX5]